MKATRTTQPYRRGGSRAPSPTLDKMRQGRAAGGENALMMASRRHRKRRLAVPRIRPFHKR